VCDLLRLSKISRWLSVNGIGGVAGRIAHPTAIPCYFGDTTLATQVIAPKALRYDEERRPHPVGTGMRKGDPPWVDDEELLKPEESFSPSSARHRYR